MLWAGDGTSKPPQGRPTARAADWPARLTQCQTERLFAGYESHNRRYAVDCALFLDGDRLLPGQRNSGSFNQVIEEGAYL